MSSSLLSEIVFLVRSPSQFLNAHQVNCLSYFIESFLTKRATAVKTQPIKLNSPISHIASKAASLILRSSRRLPLLHLYVGGTRNIPISCEFSTSKLGVKCVKKIFKNQLTSHSQLVIILLVAVKKYDLIAQLGEHHLDRVGVTGSIPVQITIHNRPRALEP